MPHSLKLMPPTVSYLSPMRRCRNALAYFARCSKLYLSPYQKISESESYPRRIVKRIVFYQRSHAGSYPWKNELCQTRFPNFT